MVMEAILFWTAVVTLGVSVLVVAVLIRGNGQIFRLDEFDPAEDFVWPKVTIVIAARNEERNIAEAVESLLQLDYDDFELLAVNDRSTDRTGEILDRIAAANPRLTVRHVGELPAGWLGKNHALHLGVEQTGGPWLLLTDADIVMHPSTLRRAVAYASLHQIDHLPMMPAVHVPGFWLQSFVVLFAIYFGAYFRPWKAKDPRSSAYVGVGAFNLVRRQVYQNAGGYRAIAMRPDDDVKFGKLIKKRGYRQEIVDGVKLIRVEWYASIRELIAGLEKNAFAGVEYRVAVVAGSSLAALITNVWPFVAVLATRGVTQALYAVIVALLLGLSIGTARALRLNPLVALGFPLMVLLFVYIQWRTMILTLASGGIRWRGTHYSLAELKANRV